MYPTNIDKFSEKLNKRDEAYVIEEEILIANGVYEGMLAHDNIIDSSLSVYSGSKLTGLKIEDVILSVPEDTPWKRIIKIFADYEKVYITYESYGDQVEAEDINRLQGSVIATQTEVNRYKASNDLKVTELQNDVQSLENKKSDKTYVDTELNKKVNKVDVYTKSQTDDRIQAVVGAAPEALDTLQEIGHALGNDPDFAGTMTNELSKKINKVAGKQLSTEDYTTPEKNKLSGIEAGANKYIHPPTHAANMIVESSSKRFVSDAEKSEWNAKETPDGAQAKVNTHENNKTNPHGVTKAQVGLGNVENIKQATKAEFDSHNSDTTKHITSTERNTWNEKSNLALGETSDTAHRGDRGKVAYNHSQSAHAPSNAQKNSDITKEEIESKLIGNITTHKHDQYVTLDDLGNAGYGDMTKSVYDTNNNGAVDKADTVPWTGVTGKPSSFAPSSHTHSIANITGLQNELNNKLSKGTTWNDLKGV